MIPPFQVYLYRLASAAQMSKKLAKDWNILDIKTSAALQDLLLRPAMGVVIAEWNPKSSFACWALEHPQVSVFWCIDAKDFIFPDSGTECLHLKMSSTEIQERIRRGHQHWNLHQTLLRKVDRVKKDRVIQAQMNDRLLKVTLDLKKAKEEVEHLSLTDALTSLHNRRFFDMQLGREILQSTRYRTPLSMFMVDIDNFKHVNDSYGHQAGDQVLSAMGHTINHMLRDTDWAARYGGEEFCVILPMTGCNGAVITAERLRMAISEQVKVAGDTRAIITASIGLCSFDPESMNCEDLIRNADRALYQAKRSGKNKVTFYNDKNGTYEDASCS